MSSAIGIGVSSNEEKHKDGSIGDIIWSETPGYQNHFNGMNGIVRVETSPQSKRVVQGENWNLSPISSQIYNDRKAHEFKMMALRH